MDRISTAASRPLACHCTKFAFVVALALLFKTCHRASAEPYAIAPSAHQGAQMLASEIQRSQQQIKPSLANQSPKSENSVGRLLRGIPVANTVFSADGTEKKHRTDKTEFLAGNVTLKG